MQRKVKNPISPTIEELQAIENEHLKPLTDDEIDKILKGIEIDVDFDTFNPFYDDEF